MALPDLTAADLIRLLDLKPLPREGGFFRETYRSAYTLPAGQGRGKSLGTAIYYLLTPETSSALHRLPTDEVYHFYLGGPVQMLQLPPDGPGRTLILGPDLLAGQHLQTVVPAGVWQGSFPLPNSPFALLGTTMAPGFEAADFEPADPDLLAGRYPDFAGLIRRLAPAG